MNQGRIWTVVKPTVGLPLFLGAVTVIALLVHYAVLTHTTWFSAYWRTARSSRLFRGLMSRGSGALAPDPSHFS
jgi:light-harvesting protein B-800-850 alpha chain